MTDTKNEKDLITVHAHGKSTEEIYDAVIKAHREAMDTGKEVLIVAYKSDWERWGTPKYLIKAFELAPKVYGVKITGRNELEKFLENLEDMGFSQHQIDDRIRCIYEIGASETISGGSQRKKQYPKKQMKEVFSVDPDKIIPHLEQLCVANEDTYGYILTSKGKEILEEYCKTEGVELIMDKIYREHEKENIPNRLLYTYLHKDSYDRWGADRVRASESDSSHGKVIHGLIGDILGFEDEKGNWRKYIHFEGNPLMENINKFWKILEDNNLVIEAPVVIFNSKGCHTRSETTRCMPIYVAQKIYRTIDKRISKDEKVLNILMIINKKSDQPKTVKDIMISGVDDYGLSERDIPLIADVINKLSEKGITSKWSSTGDVPYIMKDYQLFLNFCEDYLMEKEDLDIE